MPTRRASQAEAEEPVRRGSVDELLTRVFSHNIGSFGAQSSGKLVVMGEKLQLTISFEEPDEDGWIVARVVEVPGAISQGRTRQEARENVIDALRVVLAPDDDDPTVAAGRSEQLDLTLSA